MFEMTINDLIKKLEDFRDQEHGDFKICIGFNKSQEGCEECNPEFDEEKEGQKFVIAGAIDRFIRLNDGDKNDTLCIVHEDH